MKYKDIILDFTPLLDVIMIILFFFILFSTLGVKNVTTQAEQKKAEYEEMAEDVEREKEKIEIEWDRLRAMDENAVKNQQALNAFDDGQMLSFNLQQEDESDSWTINITQKDSATGEDKKVDVISSQKSKNLTQDIQKVLDKFSSDDNIMLVTFTYDGNVFGSNKMVISIQEAFEKIQKDNKDIYFNSINTSK